MFSDHDHISLGRDISINESAIFYHWLEEKVSNYDNFMHICILL